MVACKVQLSLPIIFSLDHIKPLRVDWVKVEMLSGEFDIRSRATCTRAGTFIKF